MSAKITVYHKEVIEGSYKLHNEIFQTNISNNPGRAEEAAPLNSDTALAVTNWAKNNYLPITNDVYYETKYEEEVYLIGDILANL